MAVNPSKLVIDEVVARLSSTVDGFNPLYNSLAPGYGLQATMAIDFSGNPSKNFIVGDVDPLDFEETSAFKYPVMTLFTTRAANQNFQKFVQFSGIVTVGLNVFITWRHNNALRYFENYPQAIEETVLTLFNRSRPGHADQDWGPEVTYNGNIELAKSPVKQGGDNWYQRLAFQLAFEVDT